MASDDQRITIDSNLDTALSTSLLSPDSENDFIDSEHILFSAPRRPFRKPTVGDANSWLIYKVPPRLREVNAVAYEPYVISIGPYHHGGYQLERLEVIKQSCFAKIVEETKLDFSKFLNAMKPLEERIRKCYEEPCLLDSENYLKMMVYDGCFIVQLIRKVYPGEDIFKREHIQTDIRYDLLLLENQLPFFVLLELDRLITPDGGGDHDQFAHLALSLFKTEVQGQEIWSESENYPSPKKEIKHLLDLVHSYCRPSPEGINQHKDFKAKEPESQRSWKFIRSATELEESGIKFLGEKMQQSLFDITFTQDTKVLKIPILHVDDNTERILRNLMAYEQFIPSGEPTYVSDYVVFMDNLINTGKDVQILCNSGIIDNWLGDDEAVAQMFNKLGDFIYSSEDFYYAEIFGKVNEHCQIKWNKWKAILKRDYFNSPWSLISFLAAVVLLLLTLIQTIFSVLSYFQW